MGLHLTGSSVTQLSNAFVSHAGPGTADDTTRLNALLAAGGTVRGKPGETYTLSAPLVIGSNTALDMRGCTLGWKSGTTGNNLLRNSAATAQRTVADAAITSGATTLTSATAAFTSADVGRSVSILGAGGGTGGLGPLTAKITAVTNGTTATVSVAAHATVTGATANIYNRDTNVKVLGGVWNRGTAAASVAEGKHGLFLHHIDNLMVEIESYLSSTAGEKYAVAIGDVTEFSAAAHHLNTVSDGIHITGPARGGQIPFVRGTTGDDMVAFTASDYAAYADVAGDITDISVGPIVAVGCREVYKVLAGAGWRVDGIKATHATGTVTASGGWVGDDVAQADTTGGTYGTIDLGVIDIDAVANVLRIVGANADKVIASVRGSAGAGQMVKVDGTSTFTVKSLVLQDGEAAGGNTFLSMASSTGTITKALIDRLVPTTTSPIFGTSAGTVTNLIVRNTVSTFTGTNGLFFASGGTVTRTDLLDCDLDVSGMTGTARPVFTRSSGGFSAITVNRGTLTGAGSSGGLLCYDATAGALSVVLEACTLTNMKRCVDLQSGAGVTAKLIQPAVDCNLEMFHTTSGGTVLGEVASITGSASRIFSSGSTGTLRINGRTLPNAVAVLTPTEGDIVNNTSSTAASGWYLGPVVYDATEVKWVPLRGYAQKGTATLVGGTVTVANTRTAAYSRIELFHETPGGTPGALLVSARVAGTSFTITSTSATDTSVVFWRAIYW